MGGGHGRRSAVGHWLPLGLDGLENVALLGVWLGLRGRRMVSGWRIRDFLVTYLLLASGRAVDELLEYFRLTRGRI